MTFRIRRSTNGGVTTIRLEGRLDAAGVAALEVECRVAESPQWLDLSDLQSLDETGVEAIRSIRAEGAEIHGASIYVRRLLGEA